MANPKLFVLYYHQVLPQQGFDVSWKTFEWELRILKSNFNIITPEDIYEYIVNDKRPNKHSVCITFDDGLTDNYTYVYPLLKKHKLKATLFTIPSRIVREDTVRPTLEDYWNNKVSYAQLHQPKPMGAAHREFFAEGKSQEFMTVAELQKIQDVFPSEAHAMVHARSFYEDTITDFYDGANWHYSDLNLFGEQPITGFPLFPRKNNIAVQKGELKKEVKDFIKNKPASYFHNPQWKKQLQEEVEHTFPQRLLIETKAERIQRVTQELTQSKTDLEKLTGRQINFFSYPFGDHDDVVADICSDIFKASFTTQKDIIRKDTPLQKIPRGSVAKDIFSFLGRIVKMRFKK